MEQAEKIIDESLQGKALVKENKSENTKKLFIESYGCQMNFSDSEIDIIRQAGELHDIGKIMILPELLNKKEKLTEHEFQLIKKHAETGYVILRNTDDNANLAKIVRSHHERFYGHG